ncbi:MAG: hypothetical protein A2521_04840 [Deltaproteobacteria bacterium RIFOXYD12_FULL_57_12]|nr:MAG: hypothetical protein A2521_04840 [Deltaproteobacteria bacterium RIFOXYD12_FULL_57_12]
MEIEPELCLHIKIAPESQCGIGGDGPAAMNNFIDTPWSYPDIFREPILTDSQWFKKLRKENFTGMNGGEITLCHNDLSMVVGDLDIVGVTALPYETNSPLLVDADAVLTFSGTAKSLQMIRRWDTECFKNARGIKDLQFHNRCSLDCLRQPC